ncbi:unnamed protein product [Brugia timori]|uniref:MEF2B n=1 Tax=Brugia timori TaxID=42155 RepID=A0A0R3R7Z7_9BILA|nr:unnamed protein product [Brugia timori]
MSTTGHERYSVLQIFKGRRGRTGHRKTCGALPAAGPYLRSSKFSFEYLLLPPRSAPGADPPKLAPEVSQRPPRPPTHRSQAIAPTVSAQFGTVTRLSVHPASPVLLTKNGPLGALDSTARLNGAAAPSYLFKV